MLQEVFEGFRETLGPTHRHTLDALQAGKAIQMRLIQQRAMLGDPNQITRIHVPEGPFHPTRGLSSSGSENEEVEQRAREQLATLRLMCGERDAQTLKFD